MEEKICDFGCGHTAVYTLKNGKFCCCKTPNSCPVTRVKNSIARKANNNSGWRNARDKKINCVYCQKEFMCFNIKKHEGSCDENPQTYINKICKNCDASFKSKVSTPTDFCCVSCSTTFRNSLNTGESNPNYNPDKYRNICFKFHKKECVVCKEENIVAVHHMDENHDNNSPENLVPLCPTHHGYIHSSFKSLIENQVNEYVTNFIKTQLPLG